MSMSSLHLGDEFLPLLENFSDRPNFHLTFHKLHERLGVRLHKSATVGNTYHISLITIQTPIECLNQLPRWNTDGPN